MKKTLSILIFLSFLLASFSFEIDLEKNDEICLRYIMKEEEGSLEFDALSTGFNSKLVIFKVYNENGKVLKEQRKLEEFHFTVNKTVSNQTFKFCIKDMDGTKKTIIFNINEKATISNKAPTKDSFEELRFLIKQLLRKLKRIEQNIHFKESLASNHIAVAEKNLNNIKYGSFAKLFIVALIAILQIMILMKFIEKKEKKFGK